MIGSLPITAQQSSDGDPDVVSGKKSQGKGAGAEEGQPGRKPRRATHKSQVAKKAVKRKPNNEGRGNKDPPADPSN